MAVTKGDAYAETTVGGIGGALRYFAARTVNTAGGPANRTPWEVNAGESIQIYFKTGVSGISPPIAPDNIRIEIAYETQAGTIIRVYEGQTPADGTAFTFYATDTGYVGGKPCAGTLRLRILAQAFAAGGALTYSVDSDDESVSANSKGAVRANMKVYGHAVTYAAGTKGAVGTAADEDVIVTVHGAALFRIIGHEEMDCRVETAGNSIVKTENVHLDAYLTSFPIAFRVDKGFLAGNNTYILSIAPAQKSQLLPAEDWTKLVIATPTQGTAFVAYAGGGPAGRLQSASSLIQVDDSLTLAVSAPAGNPTTLRGDAVNVNFTLQNSRGNNLTRPMDMQLVSLAGQVVYAIVMAPGNFTYISKATDPADHTSGGQQWQLRAREPSETQRPSPLVNAYKVSNLLAGLGMTASGAFSGPGTTFRCFEDPVLSVVTSWPNRSGVQVDVTLISNGTGLSEQTVAAQASSLVAGIKTPKTPGTYTLRSVGTADGNYGSQDLVITLVGSTYAVMAHVAISHVSRNGLIHVVVQPFLWDLINPGNIYTPSAKPGGAASFTQVPVVSLDKANDVGVPSNVTSATLTQVAGQGTAAWEGTFGPYADGDYNLHVRFVLAGLEFSENIAFSVGGLLTLREVDVINRLIVNAGQIIFTGQGTQIVESAGADESEDAWEEVVVNKNVRDQALAAFAVPKLAPDYDEQVTLEVVDRRPPETFTTGRVYEVDNGGKDGDGVYTIVDLEPVDLGGVRGTKLYLGRRFPSFLDDFEEHEKRIRKTERY